MSLPVCFNFLKFIFFNKNITNILGSIDKKIEINKKKIEKLETLARDIYDYWFVQYDFPDENRKPYKSNGGKLVWNEELKRNIPVDWKVYHLGELFNFVKGRIPKISSNVITTECNSLYITIDTINDTRRIYCSKTQMPYCEGDVLMVMDGAASGDLYCGYYGVIGSTLSMLKQKNGIMSSAFLYQILSKFKAIYKKANIGSTVPHANKNYINSLKIALPIELPDIFTSLRHKIVKLNQEIISLIAQRNFLVPLLMNGQIKVL